MRGESPLILYNGATGGLGRHVQGAATAAGLAARALTARLEDPDALANELDSLRVSAPIRFIHLAARVSVPDCEADPDGAYEINVVRATAVLDAVVAWARRSGSRVRVVYVSTGHVYAAPPVGTRVAEDMSTEPRSIYATTKLAAERRFRERAGENGIPLVIARVFGLIGPGQPANYVLPGLIGRVRSGQLNDIPGLDMARDYLDSRDVCRNLIALATVATNTESPIVNVCSGVPTTIRHLFHLVLSASGVADAATVAESAVAAPGRADDVTWLVGDPSRFIHRTGREPRTIPLEDTVRDAISAAG